MNNPGKRGCFINVTQGNKWIPITGNAHPGTKQNCDNKCRSNKRIKKSQSLEIYHLSLARADFAASVTSAG